MALPRMSVHSSVCLILVSGIFILHTHPLGGVDVPFNPLTTEARF